MKTPDEIEEAVSEICCENESGIRGFKGATAKKFAEIVQRHVLE